MKTEVQFRTTAFECMAPTSGDCLGKDLACWLIQHLRGQGIQTAEEPDEEDFGWFFVFCVGDVEHCFVIGFQPNDPARGDRWLGWVERHTGLISSIFGGRQRGIPPAAVHVIDTALKSSSDIEDLSWHDRF